MNCFQLIKTVLDETYEMIPGSLSERDDAIKNALTEMQRDYGSLLTRGCFDYSDPCKRFAYLFRYTTSHANLVWTCLKECDLQVSALFDSPRVDVACVGGGPGSDFLGVMKYCQSNAKKPRLKCLLLDRDATWGESWNDVEDKLGAESGLCTVFQPYDVTDSQSWTKFSKFYASDLFTMVYFMSKPTPTVKTILCLE